MKKFIVSVVLVLALVLTGVIAQEQTIAELAMETEDLSTLVTAVQAAGLVEVLSDPNSEWTVFAPTNEAFENLPEGVLDMLLADKELLTRVLTYHVVDGIVTSDMLTDMMAPSMEMTAPGSDLMGSELEVTVGEDGTVMVNDATVIMADIIASNGVVHVIDTVLIPAEIAAMMQEDMDMTMMEWHLYASLNPDALENDALVSLPADLSDMMNTFDGFSDIASVQSVDFTSDGTAYVTVDVAEGEGGIIVVEGMGGAESMAVGMGTRMIGGTANAGLVSPKGLEVIEDLDLVLVANFGASNIKGFSLSAEGDAAPTVFINDLGGVGGSIWDIHYNAEIDTLFAAGTTGTLFVYGNFSEDLGTTGPTAMIMPGNADGEAVGINLHGVEYDAASDTVIVTDVGSADDNTDGHIYAIPGASMANGIVTVSLHITGPDSRLGNPVDLVFDGTGIYVAEKANDLILYYENVLDASGMMDAAATTSLEITKPESVTLVPAMMEEM